MINSISPWYKILYQGTGCSTGKRLPPNNQRFC
jgi:hypothetical protein